LEEDGEEEAPEVGGRARLLAELFALASDGSSSSGSSNMSRGAFNGLGRALAAAGLRGGALDWDERCVSAARRVKSSCGVSATPKPKPTRRSPV